MDSSAYLRLGLTIGLLSLLLALERGWPRRTDAPQRRLRWTANLALVLIASLLARLLLGAGAVGAALWAQREGWGLFAQIQAPAWVEFIAALLLLDLLIYVQHRLTHHVPLLWRLHRVHHSDTVLDATTALRFHPVEILLSLGLKIGAVLLLGPAPLAILVFEVLLNATALFNHANLRLPHRLDRLLRHLVVTPDMHRVHHSVHAEETNSNYGFNLPWWDRLFGSYRDQPRDGHAQMRIGLQAFRSPDDQTPTALLRQPLRQP